MWSLFFTRWQATLAFFFFFLINKTAYFNSTKIGNVSVKIRFSTFCFATFATSLLTKVVCMAVLRVSIGGNYLDREDWINYSNLWEILYLNSFDFFHKDIQYQRFYFAKTRLVWKGRVWEELASTTERVKLIIKNEASITGYCPGLVYKLMFSFKICFLLHSGPSVNIFKLLSAWVIWNTNWSKLSVPTG